MVEDRGRGVPTGGEEDFTKSLSVLIDTYKSGRKNTDSSKKALAGMNDQLKVMYKESRKLKDPLAVLSKAMKIVEKDSRGATKAALLLARETESSASVMSTARKNAFDLEMDGVKRAMEALKGSKAHEREYLMLAEKQRGMERERFHDLRAEEIAKGKALQQSAKFSDRAQGAFMAMTAKARSNASDMAEKVGNVVGLTGDKMMKLSKILLIAGAVITLIEQKIGRAAKTAKDAAAAGFEMGGIGAVDALMGTNKGLNSFGMQLLKVSAITGISQETLASYTATFHQGMGESILAQGRNIYGLKNEVAVRNQLRENSIQFVADIASAGVAMGMTADKSLDLAIKMGVLGRSSERQVKVAMVALDHTAKKLRLPIDALIEPFMQLAEVAGETGGNVMDAANQLSEMAKTVGSLSNSQLLFFKGIEKNTPALAKFAKQAVASIMGVDQSTLLAFSMKSGETFGKSIDRVADMGFQGRKDAIFNMMNAMGKTGDTSMDRWMWGSAVTKNPGDIAGSRRMGELLEGLKTGRVKGDFTTTVAGEIDKQFAQYKTLGAAVAAGSDPVQYAITQVTNIFSAVDALHKFIIGAFWGRLKNTLSFGVLGESGGAHGPSSPAARGALILGKHLSRPTMAHVALTGGGR